jgi:hypothetical protein
VQAVLDTYPPAVYIPDDPSGGTQIDVGTVGLTLHRGTAFYGNSQFLQYDGATSAITFDTSNVVFNNNQIVRDLIVEFTTSSATHIAFDTGNGVNCCGAQIDFINDADEGDSLSGCLSIKNLNGAYIEVVNYTSSCNVSLQTGASWAGYTLINSSFSGTGYLDGAGISIISSSLGAEHVASLYASYVEVVSSQANFIGGGTWILFGQIGASSISGTLPNTGITSSNNGNLFYGLVGAGTIYSAAGKVLSDCGSTTVASTAWVSDASAFTPGTAYVPAAGAGTDTVQVGCTYTGSVYAWETM